MHTYTIKKNGYPIAQARGIRNAVLRIEIELQGTKAHWTRLEGDDAPRCKAGDNDYTMERMY